LPGDRDSKWIEDAPWRQWNPDHVWNALILILILALIGARLYHILTPIAEHGRSRHLFTTGLFSQSLTSCSTFVAAG
jgi:prolipoprotein diacylglyceryltransferase